MISRTYLTLLFAAASIASACSPTQFFGGGDSTGAPPLKPYRAVNLECADLDLSRERFDAPAFRGLLRCLNRDGALAKTEAWIQQVDDPSLEALIETVRISVFSQPRTLWGFERTHSALVRTGLLDPALSSLGNALSDPDWLIGAIEIFAPLFEKDSALVFAALEKIGRGLDAKTLVSDLETAISLLETRAVQEFHASLQLGQEKHSFEDLVMDLRTLLIHEPAAHEGHHSVLLEIGSNLESGAWSSSLNTLFGSEASLVRAKVPAISEVLKFFGKGDAQTFIGITRLLSEMNRPIICARGGVVVPNGSDYVIQELLLRPSAEARWFLERQNVLSLMAFKPFCDYPTELPTLYASILELARSSAMAPAADALRAFWNSGQVRSFTHLLSEVGAHWAKPISSFVSEFSSRDALEPLMLSAASTDEAMRRRLGAILKFWSEPDARLKGRSLLDVVGEGVRLGRPETFVSLAQSLQRLSASQEPVYQSLLRSFWNVTWVTSTNPILDVAARVLAESEKFRGAIDAFLRQSRTTEFRAAIVEISEMAKDGRLRNLVGAGVLLSHKTALRGSHEVIERSVPKVRGSFGQDISSRDLIAFSQMKVPYQSSAACQGVDLNVSLADYLGSSYEKQWGLTLSCFKESPVDYSGLVEGLEFLKSEKTEFGKSFLEMQIDLVSRNPLNGDEIRAVYQSLLRALDSGRVSRAFDLFRHWVGTPSLSTGPVLRPLLDAVSSVFSSSRAQVHDLLVYVASVLKRSDFVGLAFHLREATSGTREVLDTQRPLLDMGPTPETEFARIKRWIANKECKLISATTSEEWEYAKTQRAHEVIDEYRNGLTNWDLVDGKPRRAFSENENRESVRELLAQFADTSRSDPNSPISTAISRILRHVKVLAAEAGVSPGEYLVRWFQDRTGDFELTRYFYPEQKLPRVRLLNSLDRLELVILNNDYKAPGIPPKNFSLKFSEDLAEAWGDEDPSKWPEGIRKLYPPGSRTRPKTLAEVVKDIEKFQKRYEKLVGFPDMPKCPNKEGGSEDTVDPKSPFIELPGWAPIPVEKMQAGLFHNRQVLHVLRENLPGSGHAHAGGLKFLRALLYELHSSSSSSSENNLEIAVKFARLGALRQLGRQSARFEKGDPQFVQAVDRVISALTSNEVVSWLPTVMSPLLSAYELFGQTDVRTWEGLSRLSQSASYEALRSSEIERDLWDFFAEQSTDSLMRDASRKLRWELARKLESGELEQLLVLFQRKPDKFYRLLESLAISAERGELTEFLQILRRSGS
jgi:hypothetical protein